MVVKTKLPVPVVSPIIPYVGSMSWLERMKIALQPRKWKLVDSYALYVDYLQEELVVTVPFVTDFASVPRIFWFILSPTGILLVGAIFHDYGYRNRGVLLRKNNTIVFKRMSKAELDILLQQVTIQITGTRILPMLARIVLFIGGWYSWYHIKKRQ